MKVYVLFREGERDWRDSEVIEVFASRHHAEHAAEALVGKPVSQNSKGQIDDWVGNWSKYDFEIEEYEVRGA